MIWRPPRTWRPGDVARNLTARVLNTELRDNLLFLYDAVTGGGGGDDEGVWYDVGFSVPFTNSWTNAGGTLAPAAWRKDGEWVTLRGTISGGVIGSGTGNAFTLPEPYRPVYEQRFGVMSGTVANGYVRVLTSGVFVMAGGSVAVFDLGQIRYATV